MDVLTHAIEAYTSTANHTDGLALQTIKLVFENLSKQCEKMRFRFAKKITLLTMAGYGIC